MSSEDYKWDIRPRTDLSDDLFGVTELLRGFVRRVVSADQDRLFAIFAPWGCGKTTSLEFCEEIHNEHPKIPAELKHEDRSLWLPRFETWRFEDVENLPVAMLWHLQRSLKDCEHTKKRTGAIDSLKKLGASVALAGSRVLSRAVVGVDLVNVGKDALTLVENQMAERGGITSSDTFLQCELIDAIRAEFDRIGEELLGKDSDFDRIVIPVDDMDRCRPEAAVHLLFALKHLMVSKHFKFIVAVDRQAMAKFLSYAYRSSLPSSDAIWFLEKVFDDWAELPPPRIRMLLRRMDSMDYFPNIDAHQFTSKLENWGVIDLSKNPRRFLRAVERYRRMAETSPPPPSVAKIDGDREMLAACFRFGFFILFSEYPDEMDQFMSHPCGGVAGTDLSEAFEHCISIVRELKTQRAHKLEHPAYTYALRSAPELLSELMKGGGSGIAKLVVSFVNANSRVNTGGPPPARSLAKFLAKCFDDVLAFL